MATTIQPGFGFAVLAIRERVLFASLMVDELSEEVSRLRQYNASFTIVPRDLTKH
jgi:hypothetical protein